jgi:pilus assembly protein FimV
MSYSLSQLDAIGDVDPVAEADVYLAYGRDLQAEEILKEALRTTPDRPAIRTKLMEVYAKRRDTKGVEFMAKDLLQITQGQGPDWQRAQELGMSVDPGNPIYQSAAADVPALEMDRTLPLSAMPAVAAAMPELSSTPDAGDSVGGKIDLDISLPPTPEMLGHMHTDPQKFDPTPSFQQVTPAAKASAATDVSIDFDLPSLDMAEAVPATPTAQAPAKPFDLSTISLDLDDDQTVIKPVKPAAPVPEFVASNPVPIDVVNDPMMRKVELAHEFIQIGDVDGAKDLLKEVMADGQEVSRAKARELLDRLT